MTDTGKVATDKQQRPPIVVLHMLADGRIGGPGVRIVRVQECFDRMDEQEIDTIVACPPVQPHDYYEKAGIGHADIIWNKPNVEKPIRSGLVWLSSGFWKDISATRKVIRQVNPSVVHVNGAILVAAVLGARLENVPIVWHLNDMVVPVILAKTVKAVASACGAIIIAASGAVVDYYRLPASTPVVYPPAPLINDLAVKKESSRRRIGVLANLAPIKRVHDAIEALGLIRDRFPDIHLEIAGRILDTKLYYYEKIRKRVSELGLEERVHFLDFVEDPGAWLEELDLLVFPSESEAAPVAVIEAMACGTPLVAADIPATREIAGDAAIIVPLGDVKAFANEMAKILADKEKYRSTVQKGLRRSREVFSVDAICRQYYQVYDRALGRGLT